MMQLLAAVNQTNGQGQGFLVLAGGLLLLLILFVWIPRKRKESQKKEAPESWVPVEVTEPEVPAQEAASADAQEDEIAAAIAAVMAIYTQQSNGLNVRPMRRVGAQAPAWNAAGRRDNRGF